MEQNHDMPGPETTTPENEPAQKTGEQLTLKSILGGDILTHDFFRRQFLLLVMLVIFAIIYVANRYACQQQLIEIDRLKKELTDIKYNALTRSSELTEKSRQSKIEEYVSQGESALQTSSLHYLVRFDSAHRVTQPFGILLDTHSRQKREVNALFIADFPKNQGF